VVRTVSGNDCRDLPVSATWETVLRSSPADHSLGEGFHTRDDRMAACETKSDEEQGGLVC
jgi:hypothetical protein